MSPLDRTYHLEVRDAPVSVNASGGGARANPYIAHKEKKRWEGLWLQQLMVKRAAPFMSYCTANICVYFKRDNHRDTENYRHPVVKPLADALQKGGYLKDDDDEWFKVINFKLYEDKDLWPDWMPPLVTAVTVVELEAQYQ